MHIILLFSKPLFLRDSVIVIQECSECTWAPIGRASFLFPLGYLYRSCLAFKNDFSTKDVKHIFKIDFDNGLLPVFE